MERNNSMDERKLFRFAIFINILAFLSYLAVISYLGLFTRFMSDDYCEAILFQSGNVLDNLVMRYTTVSDRFSNILFAGLTGLLGPFAVRVLPFIMITLWVAGLTWLMSEVNSSAGLHWPRGIIVFLALVTAFIAAAQASNQFQTFFWRSAMGTHFAPLVFLGFLAAYIVMQLRQAGDGAASSPWTLVILLIGSFLVSGFSEPPAAMITVGLGMAFLFTWLRVKNGRRQRLLILSSALIGSVLALLVMILAPANSLRLGDAPPPILIVFLERSFRFVIEFTVDWFRVLPLPALFMLTASFLVSLVQNLLTPPALTDSQRRSLAAILLVTPLIAYLLIVASFAPSAYGQSFPVPRARFAGQLILVLTLMVEGAGLGILFAQWKPRVLGALSPSILTSILLIVAALYPLRAALLATGNVPEYRARAEAWDAREAQIRSLRAQGETDLIIDQFNGIYGVKELDSDPNHWVNLCAAVYYDVNSISAIPAQKP